MMAVPLVRGGDVGIEGRGLIAEVPLQLDEYTFVAQWADASENQTWKSAPSRNDLRVRAVARMSKAFRTGKSALILPAVPA
jgi:hypothetical protein